MDFYYLPGSPPCRAVIMAAKSVGIELNKKLLNLSAGEHLTPKYLKLNPQHTIPTLVDDGLSLWESRAIMIYLVEKYAKTDSLYPKCPKTQGTINQRLYFDMGTLYKAFTEYFFPQIFQKKPADPEKLKQIEKAFDLLDTFLLGRTFAVGESLTLADIAFVSTISTYAIVDFDFSKWQNVSRWFENAKQVTPGFAENWDGCLEFKRKFLS